MMPLTPKLALASLLVSLPLTLSACGDKCPTPDQICNCSAAAKAGESAALYAAGKLKKDTAITVETGENVRYVCPQAVVPADEKVDLYFRVMKPQKSVVITVTDGDNVLLSRKAIKVNPGEMEKATVSVNGISSLKVSVKEA